MGRLLQIYMAKQPGCAEEPLGTGKEPKNTVPSGSAKEPPGTGKEPENTVPSGSGGSLMDIQHCVNNEMVIGCGSFHGAGMAFNDIIYTF